MNRRGSLLAAIVIVVAFTIVLLLSGVGAGAAPAATTGTFLRATKIDLIANDIIYDPGRDVIWASIPTGGGSYGNSVTPINRDGSLGEKIYVGSEPNKLALSDDGQYLYVGLDGAGAVRRVDLTTGVAGLQWPLGTSFCGKLSVDDMVVLEGDAHAVALSRRNAGCSPRHEGVAVYDDGLMRPETTPGHTGSNAIERSATADILYGYNNETSEFGFRVMATSEDGITTTQTILGLIGGYGMDIRYADGRVYATTGEVVDVDTLTSAGTFPATGLVAPDPVAGRVYFIELNFTPLFRAFEMATFLPLYDIEVPELAQDFGYGRAFIPLGDDLFAFVKNDGAIYFLQLFQGYEVSGRVSDEEGNGLPGVTVSAAGGYDDVTDGNGIYTFGVPAGDYTLTPTFEDYGFEPATRQITVPPDVAGQDFVGSPPTYSISGKIVDGTGQPVAGVLVYNYATQPVPTAADGTFTFTGLPAGTYQIQPDRTGYHFEPHYLGVTVPPDATDINFIAEAQPTIYLPVIRN